MIPRSYLSFTSSYNPNLSQPVVLRIGASALIVSGNWDPAITDGYNILEYYKKSCLEPLFWLPDDSTEPLSHLATTWEYEYWPIEMNAQGFNNTGGVKAIDITLRDGVEFHDGSNWNATVAKWNIDRLFVITGNLTGNANGIYDQRNAGIYWVDVEDVIPYFTSSWNLSEYDAPDAVPPGTPPDPSRYSYYYLTNPDGPSPVIANNSNPYGGWDPFALNFIHYAPYDKFPVVRWVELVEDLPSGGKIRVHWNSWNPDGMEGGLSLPQISMQAYKDYNETGYYGYNTGKDMIGTGAYIYQEHDELADWGYMIKNENYWNKTGLEADGWFSADQVELFQFPPHNLGKDAQNIALLSHFIDYAFDTMTMPIDYDAVMVNPNINYIEYGVSDYITQITLNCINETWWSGGVMYPGEPSEFNFSWIDINSWYPHCSADPAANGIPRSLREALNYAFDYDTYIHTFMDDRVVRAGGMLGTENIYYNSSIPLINYDLTKARELLLNITSHDIYSLTDIVWSDNAYNHNFSSQLAMRGLTDPSDNPTNNAAWQTVATTNPIFIINFYWDDAHQDLADQFELACNNLGVAIVQEADNKAPAGTTLWDHCIGSYWTQTFDGVHSIWSAQAWMMDYPMPETNPEGWVEATYGDPSKGSWRTVDTPTELWPMWNFAFCYDDEVDYWLERVEYGNQMEKLKWLSKIAEKEQNELFPMIYVSQGKEGRVLWNDWEMNFNRGDLFFANFRYTPPTPPGDISLDSDAGTPDIDGNFNLIWNVSLGADNYSIYRYGSKITEINGSLVVMADQVAISPFPISGLTDGEYYFVVVAHNQYGETMSNNFHITVQISQDPPPSFILSSDAEFPDGDGFFNLSWAYPDGADNYSLYMHNQQITVIDSSLTLLLDQIATSPFPVTGLSNGEYYFVVVAHNKYGDTMSNNVHVTVNIPGEPTEPEISGYNTLVIFCIAICTAVILFKKRKIRLRWK